ncbi:MAG: hypothetical protein ABI649_08755 [Gaiellaceae bacterium]
MRRSVIAFAVALVAAAVLASTALAKGGGVELSSTPFGTNAGDTWSGTLTVFADPGIVARAAPSITIKNLGTGETQTFGTKPAKVPTTPAASAFVYNVVFPQAGRYAYTATDGVTDREYRFPIVSIAAPDTAVPRPPSSSGGSDSFPLWAPIAGGIAILFAAAGWGFYAQRRRFGLSH